MNRRLLLFYTCFAGIFFSYLTFGFIQEKIQKSEYENAEKFTYILTLVFFQSIFSCILGFLICSAYNVWDNPSPKSYYMGCSFCYLSAMLASNYALNWVSYPTQVIGKSCKPIPILILTTILAQRSHHFIRWISSFLMVAGVILFHLFKPGKEIDYSMSPGDFLIVTSLMFDGFTASFQEVINKEYKTNSYLLMYQLNKWAVIFLFPFVLFVEGSSAYQFMIRNPQVLPLIFGFSFTSAIGQIFIYLTLTNFGPLTLSLLTTLRKFFTVLGSVVIFGHTLSNLQQLSVLVVFTGILMDNFGKSSISEKDKEIVSNEEKKTS